MVPDSTVGFSYVKDPYSSLYHMQPRYEIALANINNHDINLININMQIQYPSL
jgi:hypothetical protein